MRGRMLRTKIDREVAERRFAHGLLLRLLVARQRIVGPFPGREEIEIAEFLTKTHRLVDYAFFLVVVAHPHQRGEGKILSQRMTLEAVIGEDAPHVGMTGEQHAIEIVGLALEPVGAGKYS